MPLSDGIFTLTDEDGNELGTFTSASDGIVTMMYEFERGKLYTLRQTAAPKGYVGLQKIVRFKVNSDDTISLFYEDGTTPWGQNDSLDTHWSNSKSGENGILAFVDVYNKPFNFLIEKMDGDDNSVFLSNAHFALYKQQNTTIDGYVKNKEPMTGFEDMVTQNGVVYVCGGNSNRVIRPSPEGSVYFLTETQAPFNYKQLTDDIVFRVSPIGVPSLISDSYNGQLIETEDSYIYTLSVPNTVDDPSLQLLTIEKKVEGAFGDKMKDFTFTINVKNAGEGADFIWAKNGEKQPDMQRTGGTFTMKHNDRVEFALPADVEITVTEDNEHYDTTFKLGDGEAESVRKMTFTFTEPTKLLVTNTLNKELPLGVETLSIILRAVLFIAVPVLPIAGILYYRRRRRENA